MADNAKRTCFFVANAVIILCIHVDREVIRCVCGGQLRVCEEEEVDLALRDSLLLARVAVDTVHVSVLLVDDGRDLSVYEGERVCVCK